MRVHFGVERDVREEVLGVRDVPERLLQQESELVTSHRYWAPRQRTDIMPIR
jgi:hypothetical protein